MKRGIAITTVVVGTLLLVLGTWGLSRGHGWGSWGQRGIIYFLLEHREELGLTVEQVSTLESIRKGFYEKTAPLNEEIRKAYQELRDLMRADEINVEAATAKVRRIADLRAQVGEQLVEAWASGKQALTLEQRQKARDLWSQSK